MMWTPSKEFFLKRQIVLWGKKPRLQYVLLRTEDGEKIVAIEEGDIMGDNQRNEGEGLRVDLVDVILALWTKIWYILGALFIGALVGFIVSAFLMTPKYTSKASVFVNNYNTGISYADTQLSLQIVYDYKEVVVTDDMLSAVLLEEGLQNEMSISQLRSEISMKNNEETRVIEIYVTDEDPKRAQRLVNRIVEVSKTYFMDLLDQDVVKEVGKANKPGSKSSPNIVRYTVLGGLVAVLLILIVLVAIFLFDNSIKTADDIERYLNLPTLASVPTMAAPGKKDRKSGKKSDGKKGA